MILLIDNYDSFVYNLARYFERLGQPTRVVRNDRLDLAELERCPPRAVVLSPGPCRPQQAGCCLDVVRQLDAAVPLLGICLGHQVIGEALGGQVVRAPIPMHGRTSTVRHDGRGVFEGIPNPFTACRYHSLVVDERTMPDCLEISARSEDGPVMGVRHRTRPIVGLQFHPESILTEHGYALLAGFLRLAQLNYDPAIAQLKEEWQPPPRLPGWVPAQPLTF